MTRIAGGGPAARARAAFADAHGRPPASMVQGPGRVNLIGEHTDYNDGFVLPMAIDRAVYLALSPRDDGVVDVVAADLGESGTFAVAEARERRSRGDARAPGGWLEYARAAAWALQEDGLSLRGFDGAIASDVPVGAGLASSAALELALAAAFHATSGFEWEASRIARLMQRAENAWVGVQTGIMDQLVGAAGVAGHALLIDCRSLGATSVPLPAGFAVVVLDTSTRRSLVGSGYDERRRECEVAAASLGAGALRDVDEERLEDARGTIGERAFRRARHVIRENARTLAAADAMARGDAATLGALMDASHDSLRDDFEVSSEALDAIVEAARAAPGCVGARMTGGGFGGCAVALVDEGEVAPFVAAVERAYAARTPHRASVYVCRAARGAGPVPLR